MTDEAKAVASFPTTISVTDEVPRDFEDATADSEFFDFFPVKCFSSNMMRLHGLDDLRREIAEATGKELSDSAEPADDTLELSSSVSGSGRLGSSECFLYFFSSDDANSAFKREIPFLLLGVFLIIKGLIIIFYVVQMI